MYYFKPCFANFKVICFVCYKKAITLFQFLIAIVITDGRSQDDVIIPANSLKSNGNSKYLYYQNILKLQ